MAGLAAGFPIEALKARASQCQLSFSEPGVFPVGHIDIVLPDGRVPCSSLGSVVLARVPPMPAPDG